MAEVKHRKRIPKQRKKKNRLYILWSEYGWVWREKQYFSGRVPVEFRWSYSSIDYLSIVLNNVEKGEKEEAKKNDDVLGYIGCEPFELQIYQVGRSYWRKQKKRIFANKLKKRVELTTFHMANNGTGNNGKKFKYFGKCD